MDDISWRLGLDASPAAREMRTFEAKVSAFGKGLVATWQKVGATIGGVGLIAGVKRLTDFTDRLQGTSEALDVSTDFLQTFSFAASQSSSSSAIAIKGLERLSNKIGQAREGNKDAISSFEKYGIALRDVNGNARSTEDVIKDIADLMQQTSDGTLRAAIAFDLLGKGSTSLIPLLRGGADGLEEFSKRVNKLSTSDLAAVNKLKDQFDALGNSIMVAAGKFFSVFPLIGSPGLKSPKAPATPETNEAQKRIDEYAAKMASFKRTIEMEEQFEKEEEAFYKQKIKEETEIGRIVEQTAELKRKGDQESLTLTEQLNELAFERGLLDTHNAKTLLEDAKKQLDIEKKNAEIAAKAKEIEDARTRAIAEQVRLTNEYGQARARIANLEAGLKTAKEDRSRLTLEELAALDPRFASGRFQQEILTAQRIQDLEVEANAFAGRNTPYSERLFGQADQLRSGLTSLTSRERDPWGDMGKSISESRDLLESIEAALTDNGIVVRNAR